MAAGRLLPSLLLLLVVESSAISGSRGEPSRHNCDDGEYLHQDYCCKYCRAGTYVAKHCKVPHTEGICSRCTDGKDYTAHANGLDECIRCKLCKDDQITVSICTSTSDTECQCKPGYFCPTQGCEMCYRCKPKCPEGKEIVRKCNATGSANAAGWVGGAFVFVFVIVLSVCLLYKKWTSYNKTNKENKDAEKDMESEDSTEIFFVPEMENANASTPILEIQNSVQSPPVLAVNSPNSALRNESPEDTRITFCERSSLLLNDENNSCEESYHRTARYSAPVKPPDKPNFVFQTEQSNMSNGRMSVSQMVRDSEARPHIVVKDLSQEALSESFYYFIKEVPPRNWNMFMRTHLTDNEIDKTTLDHPKDTEERYYQMLIIWRNKFGNEASIIKLLDSLWNIGLRRSHENLVNYLISKDIITKLEAKV
ncbi:tumor necrosis factor receptor superfamily member 10B-like isoform X2 [Emydura macquarii macquarii]|uniref:tumor necrosis factor receptor superfamily member 10B-like isoform X2 n=1 Tax=Emydura macquarii macquarii TaxID=1129001 RepID=UPI00352B30D9